MTEKLVSQLESICAGLNTKLIGPAKTLQMKTGINFDFLPPKLQKPLNFCALIFCLFIIIVTYPNSIIFNLMSIVYPIYHKNCVNMAQNSSSMYNKYWTLFGALTMIDSVVGFVLRLVPGYYYLRIAFIYAIIQKDFALVQPVHSILSGLFCKIVLSINNKFCDRSNLSSIALVAMDRLAADAMNMLSESESSDSTTDEVVTNDMDKVVDNDMDKVVNKVVDKVGDNDMDKVVDKVVNKVVDNGVDLANDAGSDGDNVEH